MQSRLYNILELGGLAVLKKRRPDGFYAEETTYLILHYFAWLNVNYRYGPFSQLKELIAYAKKIRKTFGTGKYGNTQFFFPRHEQTALGKSLIKRVRGIFGTEFETISFFEFISLLINISKES